LEYTIRGGAAAVGTAVGVVAVGASNGGLELLLIVYTTVGTVPQVAKGSPKHTLFEVRRSPGILLD
jgi:hypothetical protein